MNDTIIRILELEPNFRKLVILANALSDMNPNEKRFAWPAIHELLFGMIGWGRPESSIFCNFPTHPFLYSSEAWAEAKSYLKEMVFGSDG